MVRNFEEAARAAEAKHTNVVGACQAITRGYYLAVSAGDFDGDGAADAEDGWKKEPAHARHFDKKPRRGAPCAFLGGRKDHGHRCIAVGDRNGILRSSDFNGITKRYQEGVMGNGTADEIARAMGVTWAGWSDTIDGEPIPEPPPPPATRLSNFHKTRPRYDVKILERAQKEHHRQDIAKVLGRIEVAMNKLPHDKTKTRVFQVLKAWKNDRVIRMGLLNQAVEHGRHGTVEHVRDELRHLISTLDKR